MLHMCARLSNLHKLTNSELISRLATLWHKDKFKVIKIKSRRNLESAVKHDDLWTIAGNHCAESSKCFGTTGNTDVGG